MNTNDTSKPAAKPCPKAFSRKADQNKLFKANKYVLLPDDDVQEFKDLVRDLVNHYQPQNVQELLIVGSILSCHWRLRRATQAESEIYQMYRFHKGHLCGPGTAFAQDSAQTGAISKLTRVMASIEETRRDAKREFSALRTAPMVRPRQRRA